MKKLALAKSFEFEIVDFLKKPVVVDWETEHKGVTVDVEWVKTLLWHCAHVHWMEMLEHENKANPNYKAEAEADLAQRPDWSDEAKDFLRSSWTRKRGATGKNMNPRPGAKVAAPITPLHDVYYEAWFWWKEAGLKRFSPNTNADRYGRDHSRADRHDYWNPAARLLLRVVPWLDDSYSEQNVTGLIETMKRKKYASDAAKEQRRKRERAAAVAKPRKRTRPQSV